MNLDSLQYNTLIKLISFVKFNCDDVESRYFAGSPIVGEILRDLQEDFNKKINRDLSLEINDVGPLYNLVVNGVRENLNRTIEWKDMDNESKLTHITNLCSPYVLKEDYITDLLNYGNEYHN